MDEFDTLLRTRRMRWEYREEAVPLGHAAEHLNQLGRDGWELASAVPVSVRRSALDPAAVPGLACIFKRPAVAEVGR